MLRAADTPLRYYRSRQRPRLPMPYSSPTILAPRCRRRYILHIRFPPTDARRVPRRYVNRVYTTSFFRPNMPIHASMLP